MSDPIPVNPDVLRWARDSMRLSLEEVAGRMNKRVSDIEAWERGDESPTYIQLERLAYDIYKRPVALFFFPDVPDEDAVEQSFRTLAGAGIAAYAPAYPFSAAQGQSVSTEPC